MEREQEGHGILSRVPRTGQSVQVLEEATTTPEQIRPRTGQSVQIVEKVTSTPEHIRPLLPYQNGSRAIMETNAQDMWGSQSSSSAEASSANCRPTLMAMGIQNWLRMETLNSGPNPEVFVGPRSWNQIGGFVGPPDYPSTGPNSCGSASTITPQARIDEPDVSPHGNCLSICCLGKYPLTLHQQARLYGTIALSNPPPIENMRSHEPNQHLGHCEGIIDISKTLKRHADWDLPTTHDTLRPVKVLKLKEIVASNDRKREASTTKSPRRGAGRSRGRRRGGRTSHGRNSPPIMAEANLTEVQIEEGPLDIGLLSGNECNEQKEISRVSGGGGWPTTAARPQ